MLRASAWWAPLSISHAARSIALLPGSTATPAESGLEAIDHLREIVPYASAALFAWDPFTESHCAIANIGYGPKTLGYLGDEHYERCRAYRTMRTADPRPTRWCDNSFEYSKTFPAEQVFTPAGYVEGLTACLFSDDGRYTGALHLSTDDTRYPSDEARDMIEWLQPILAAVCDLTRTAAALASMLEPQGNAAGLSPEGELFALPGRTPGPHLLQSSSLSRKLRHMVQRNQTNRGFFWRDEANEWHRVRIFSTSLTRVVCERTAPLPYGLTPRELEVLTLMTDGCSNRAIADHLVLSVRTVNTHVEHVLEKLDSSSRVACATRAVEEGLMVSVNAAASVR